jgi:hypothetical protein
MIKAAEMLGDIHDMKMNVFLKTGEVFMDKDFPPIPVSTHERTLSFWDGDTLVCYPMEQVLKFEYTFQA